MRRAMTRLTFSASRSSSAPASGAAGGTAGLGPIITGGFGAPGSRVAGDAAGRGAGASAKYAGSTIGAFASPLRGSSETTRGRVSGPSFTPVAGGDRIAGEDGSAATSDRRAACGMRSSETTRGCANGVSPAPIAGWIAARAENGRTATDAPRPRPGSRPLDPAPTGIAPGAGYGAGRCPGLSDKLAICDTGGEARATLRPSGGGAGVLPSGVGAGPSSLPRSDWAMRGGEAAGMVATARISPVAPISRVGPVSRAAPISCTIAEGGICGRAIIPAPLTVPVGALPAGRTWRLTRTRRCGASTEGDDVDRDSPSRLGDKIAEARGGRVRRRRREKIVEAKRERARQRRGQPGEIVGFSLGRTGKQARQQRKQFADPADLTRHLGL